MTSTVPLYVRVMGDSWSRIANPVRRVHATHSITRAHGNLRIEHGRHYLASVIAWMLRLPRPGAAADTQLIVTACAGGERWQRTMAGRCVETRQYESNDCEIAERYGVLEFRFHLNASGGSLLYHQREAALWVGLGRVRLPGSWAPRIEAREDPAGPLRVHIDVSIALPWIGLLITYGGIITVEEVPA